MKTLLIILLFLFITKLGFAQKDKDSVVFSIPLVNGKMVYADSIKVKAHSSIKLDSVAKKWFIAYFKYHQPDTISKDRSLKSSVSSQGLLEFRAPPNSLKLVYYDYFLKVNIEIDCKDGYYTYKIFDAYFRPKSDFFNKVVSHPTTPEYLIDLYKTKHYGGFRQFDGPIIRYYLSCVNTAILNCIASLNKAMAN